MIPNKPVQFSYDKPNDILYVDLLRPLAAYSEEIDNGIYLRINPNDETVVGVTIFSYKNRNINDLNSKIDFFVDWENINKQIIKS